MKNSKKQIRLISTVSTEKSLSKILSKSFENCSYSENKMIGKEKLEKLEKQVEEGKFKDSKILAQYLTKKTGRYVVYCKDSKHMHEMIKNARNMFSKVNENIKISHLGKNMYNEAKKDVVEKFAYDKDDECLKLLFVTSTLDKKIQFPNIDGLILLNSNSGAINKNVIILDNVLEVCPTNSTIIQFLDTDAAIRMTPEIRNRMEKKEEYDIKFEDSDYFKEVKKVRDIIMEVGISYDFKFDIMKEYLDENEDNTLTFNTEYKGYKIGIWQHNLRQFHTKGKLSIKEELLKQFEEIGVLGERKRREKTSDKKKFELLEKYKEENPKERITINTVDKDGNPIGYYRQWLQIKVNKNESDLTQEELEYLFNKNILNLSSDEISLIAKRYNIDTSIVNRIVREYKDIDKFVGLYKEGKAECKNVDLNKRGIVISKSKISQKNKQAYLSLIKAIYNEDIMQDLSKFIVEENILEAIYTLPEKEQRIIAKTFGIEGDKKATQAELAKEEGLSRARIGQIYKKGLEDLKQSIKIYLIDDVLDKDEKLKSKQYNIRRMSDKEWKKYLTDMELKYLNLKPYLIEKLRANGYTKISDLIDVDKEELIKISYLGEGKARQIISKIDKIKFEPKTAKLMRMQKKIHENNKLIQGYNKAYDYYMNQEDIFNKDEVIPPSIIEKESTLSKKKYKKIQKEEVLSDLDSEIKNQDKKTSEIEKVLLSSNIDLYEKIKNN